MDYVKESLLSESCGGILDEFFSSLSFKIMKMEA